MSEAPLPHGETDSGRLPGLPRWVVLLALGALAVIVVLVVAMLFLGGEHGPGMHGG